MQSLQRGSAGRRLAQILGLLIAAMAAVAPSRAQAPAAGGPESSAADHFALPALEARVAKLWPIIAEITGTPEGPPPIVRVVTEEELATILCEEAVVPVIAPLPDRSELAARFFRTQRFAQRMNANVVLAKVELSSGDVLILPSVLQRMGTMVGVPELATDPGILDVLLLHELTHVVQVRRAGLLGAWCRALQLPARKALAYVTEGQAEHIAGIGAARIGRDKELLRFRRIFTPDRGAGIDGFFVTLLESLYGAPYREGPQFFARAAERLGLERAMQWGIAAPPAQAGELSDPDRWVERVLAAEPAPLAPPSPSAGAPGRLRLHRSMGWAGDAEVRVALWQAEEGRVLNLRGHPDALELPAALGDKPFMSGVVWEGARPSLNWFGAEVSKSAPGRYEIQPLIDGDRALALKVLDAHSKEPIPGAELRKLWREPYVPSEGPTLPPWGSLSPGATWIADEAGLVRVEAEERGRLQYGLVSAPGYRARVVAGLSGGLATPEVHLEPGSTLFLRLGQEEQWPKGYALHVGIVETYAPGFSRVNRTERFSPIGDSPWIMHGLAPADYELALAPREYGDVFEPLWLATGGSRRAQLPELRWRDVTWGPVSATSESRQSFDPTEMLRRLKEEQLPEELPADPEVEEETVEVPDEEIEGEDAPLPGSKAERLADSAFTRATAARLRAYEDGLKSLRGARRRVQLDAGAVQYVDWTLEEAPMARDIEVKVLASSAWGQPKAGQALFLKERAVIAQGAIHWQSGAAGDFEGVVRLEETAAAPDELWLPAQGAVMALRLGEARQELRLPEPARFEVLVLDAAGEPVRTRVRTYHLREGVDNNVRPMQRPRGIDELFSLRTDRNGRASWLAPAAPAIVVLQHRGEEEQHILALPGETTRIEPGKGNASILLAMGPPGIALPVGLRLELDDGRGDPRVWTVSREGELEFALAGIEPKSYRIKITGPPEEGGAAILLEARLALTPGQTSVLHLERLFAQR